MDVLRCSECECVGDTREGCFGSALAVVDSLLAVGNALNGSGAQFTCFSGTKVRKLTQLLVAVGNALNGSVLLYERTVVGPAGHGLALRWDLRRILVRLPSTKVQILTQLLVHEYKY